MREVFGIPVDTLLVILAVAVAVALGVVAVLAVRNRILLKLAVRNVGRRRGRSALIVVGLMLGTTIIAAALTTGDTMNNTIRGTAVDALGATDETIAARGAVDDIPGALGAATGTGWLAEGTVDRVESALSGSGLVDGVTGAIVEQVAVQAPVQRQSEPSVTLFAADPARMSGLLPDRRHGRREARARRPAPRRGVPEPEGRGGASRRGGRSCARLRGWDDARRPACATSCASTAPAPRTPRCSCPSRQRSGSSPTRARSVPCSSRTAVAPTAGAALSDDVATRLGPVADELGLEVQTLKQDALEDADAAGTAFMAFFTTFGTFSIAAGILLIFLIFVMLAAERRGELGIARAIGTRRGHLVEMFTFEGAAYDLAAAAVGALLGALVAFGMVIVMAKAFGAADADEGLQIEYAVSARSLVIAFAIGILLTLVVVAFSAWRVSVMTISTAIRNLPEPPVTRRRRRLVLALVGLVIGLVLAFLGLRGRQRDAVAARCLSRPDEPRSAAPPRGRPGADRIHVVRRRRRRLPAAAVAVPGCRLRHARDELLDVDRLRPDDRGRHRVGDRLQRRSPARRVHAGLRPHSVARARAAHVHGISAARALPDRHHARDVHARGLHARHRIRLQRFVRQVDRRRRRRWRLPGARGHGRCGAGGRHGGGAEDRARDPARGHPVRGQPVRSRRRGEAARHGS